jgi:Uma2 family endonuclease
VGVGRYNYTDYLSIPESHSRHEIVDGELFVTPTPRINHQVVAFDLTRLMREVAGANHLGEAMGPITVHLHDELVLEPDIVFVRRDRLHIADPEGHVHGPPDVVVEILSPSTRHHDRTLKRKRCLEEGVDQVWIVDIDGRLIEVWRAGVPEPEVSTEVLRWRVGDSVFEIPLVEVFQGVR